MIEIRHRFTQQIITTIAADSLSGADLSGANLSGANLSDADLSDADLRGANLRDANLRDANLRGANLRGANLRDANLRDANLRDANLSGATLSDANLSRANLSGATLSDANLRGANLRDANLRDANLRDANLRDANLSGAQGIPSAKSFLAQFSRDPDGIIVYRAQCGEYPPPAHWTFAPGQFLAETPNPDRCTMCGCGVSFATLEWVRRTYSPDRTVWRCRINWEDLADVVVPFGTDGKARCARLELIEIVK